jgi:hypothetical protein
MSGLRPGSCSRALTPPGTLPGDLATQTAAELLLVAGRRAGRASTPWRAGALTRAKPAIGPGHAEHETRAGAPAPRRPGGRACGAKRT